MSDAQAPPRAPVASVPTLPLELADILEILPHRWPFVLVDRVTHLVLESEGAGSSIIGIKAVGFNEPWFAGHFPGQPILPGVLILEALAQVGGILAFVSDAAGGTAVQGAPRFLSADRVKFRRAVVPGDVLELRAELVQRRTGVYRLRGQARVGGVIVAEAELLIGAIRAPLSRDPSP